MACPGKQKKKCDFSFASSFDNSLSKDGGISVYRDRTRRIRSNRYCRLFRRFDSRVIGGVKDRRCVPLIPECLISCADGETLISESPCKRVMFFI